MAIYNHISVNREPLMAQVAARPTPPAMLQTESNIPFLAETYFSLKVVGLSDTEEVIQKYASVIYIW